MVSPERLGYTTKPKSQELLNEHNLIRFVVLLDASMASMDKHDCHPARPLVSVVAVKGFGGRKTFHRAAALLIHQPSDKS